MKLNDMSWKRPFLWSLFCASCSAFAIISVLSLLDEDAATEFVFVAGVALWVFVLVYSDGRLQRRFKLRQIEARD